MKRRLHPYMLVFLLCLFSPVLSAGKGSKATVILVMDQRTFDGIGASIEDAVRKGYQDVTVRITPGVYQFRENHIQLQMKKWDQVSITLQGEDAVLIGAGPDSRNPRFSPDICYLDAQLARKTFWTRMQRARRPVSVTDADKGSCVLRAADPSLTVPNCDGVMVQVTEWFLSRVYPVTRIRAGRIYFTETDLFRYGIFWNVNADQYFGKQLPRYRLLNLPSMRTETVHACEAARFLHLLGCSFRSFTVDGLSFKGNAGHENLLDYYHCKAESFVVQNCTFENLMNYAVYLSSTDNMVFKGNTARGCARQVINADIYSKHARIIGNRFEGNGIGLQNTCNVVCWGEDFVVSDNTFCNFGYGAVCVGRHYTQEKDHLITGVVERNRIFQTDSYCTAAPMEGLMDSGAVYVCTQNDRVVIRNNEIHDIDGPAGNRGIFCDDGTNGVVITGNRILRVRNSYTIDLRRCASVETEAGSKVSRTNIHDEMYGNYVDGAVRFERRGGDDGCKVGENFRVTK